MFSKMWFEAKQYKQSIQPLQCHVERREASYSGKGAAILKSSLRYISILFGLELKAEGVDLRTKKGCQHSRILNPSLATTYDSKYLSNQQLNHRSVI